MSVATQLGLADPDNDLLGLARQRWPQWTGQHPALRVVDDLLDLPGWLASAEKDHGDQVLHTLARLASPRGGDDVAASGALVWLLLPGASLLAHRLRTLTHRIDEVVAAQLWVEARSFPWERGRKVAANVLMNTRKGVLADLGVGEHLRHLDPAWAKALVLSPTADLWAVIETSQPEREPAALVELEEVLAWAVREGIVGAADCQLLMCLAAEADKAGPGAARRGRQGLTAKAASETVAEQWGLLPRTVRRRTQRTLDALSQAQTRTGIPA
jgi:hypothetical protein